MEIKRSKLAFRVNSLLFVVRFKNVHVFTKVKLSNMHVQLHVYSVAIQYCCFVLHVVGVVNIFILLNL